MFEEARKVWVEVRKPGHKNSKPNCRKDVDPMYIKNQGKNSLHNLLHSIKVDGNMLNKY